MFWFIKFYYILIGIMCMLAPSFLEMVKCLWYSLYSRAGNWQEEPDKFLYDIYNYIHLNRQRVDIIQQRFSIDGDYSISNHIFEFLGYSAVEIDGRKNYLLPNAADLLDILTDLDENSDYYELIGSSQKMLYDTEHAMIINIQDRRHVVKFDDDLINVQPGICERDEIEKSKEEIKHSDDDDVKSEDQRFDDKLKLDQDDAKSNEQQGLITDGAIGCTTDNNVENVKSTSNKE